jgi:DNA-binding transcriptional MocR family regulator
MEIDCMVAKTGMTGSASWTPVVRKSDGPVYLAIAEAIAADVKSGVLVAGMRLPPQRALAARLGIDFTTVSRAYAEARQRGLVEGKVGMGTYVTAQRALREPALARNGLVDMSMNLPPQFDNPGLVARVWSGIAELQHSGGLALLLRYQEAGGTTMDRQAGTQWLAPRLPGITPDRVLVCPGAQGALLALVSLLAQAGDTICAEELLYPGFRSLAAQLKITLHPLAMDGEGIDPDAFAAACRHTKPKALYCTPTLHNPTTATMSLARRQAIIAVARQYGVPIIEDDAYGLLPKASLPPLAGLAPEMTYHVAGLAKCLSPALRIAYLAVPDSRTASRVATALRATVSMASPLTAAIATGWIADGTATAILDAIREEAARRQRLAQRILPATSGVARSEGFHLWLPLPSPWSRGDFASQLRSGGIGVVVSDAFSLTAPPPEAVRIGLGAVPREDLEASLEAIADCLKRAPAAASMVV